jgi:hypothetical protein
MRQPQSTRFFSTADGLVISMIAIAVGAIRVAIALAQHESFGAEATLGLALVLAGIVGIAAALAQR